MSRVLPYNAKQWEIPLLLDGGRTVARRPVKSKQYLGLGEKAPLECLESVVHRYANMSDADVISMNYKPPYQPGDVLYVRETWKYYEKAAGYGEAFRITQRIAYKADENRSEVQKSSEWYEGKWTPSIHMPKEAARIWLKVTDVRVERLHDITTDQIDKEGVETEYPFVLNGRERRYAFSQLWTSTLKKPNLARYGWNANPWVWVIEFERCEKPESEENMEYKEYCVTCK